MDRTFITRYANWNPITCKVPAKLLVGADDETIVRKAVGHAFPEQLKGHWEDGPDRRVVLDKANPGVWVGRRLKEQSGGKDEPFYVMEI